MDIKGWIALDIDGTITLDKYSVPQQVTAYLRQLSQEGWRIALVTGRPYAFASMALSAFDFPYTFLLQNGSLAMEMPQKKVLFKTYISGGLIPFFEKAYEGIDSDFLIYAGYEKGDFCYWRPSRFSPEDLSYLQDLQKRQKENWQAADRYEDLKLDSFPLVKCFGKEQRVDTLAKRFRAFEEFEVSNIQDPFVEGYRILLITDRNASKGSSFSKVVQMEGKRGVVIAAGDDENDISLLEAADVKIAMHHAPATLRQRADFIAPPTQECGIITALQMAIRNVG